MRESLYKFLELVLEWRTDCHIAFLLSCVYINWPKKKKKLLQSLIFSYLKKKREEDTIAEICITLFYLCRKILRFQTSWERQRERERGFNNKALKSLSTAATWKAKLRSHFQPMQGRNQSYVCKTYMSVN